MTPSKVEELGEAKRDQRTTKALSTTFYFPHRKKGEKTHGQKQEHVYPEMNERVLADLASLRKERPGGIIDRARQAQNLGDLTSLIFIYHEVTTLRHASSRTVRRVERHLRERRSQAVITIELKQSHIDAGAARKENRCLTCPLALALTEHFKYPFGTDGKDVFKAALDEKGQIKGHGGVTHELDFVGRQLVIDADTGKPISPCNFQIFPITS